MLNSLIFIQKAVFIFIFIPMLFLTFLEVFKHNKNKFNRISAFIIVGLLSFIITMILSAIIVNIDNSYIDVNFAFFNQLKTLITNSMKNVAKVINVLCVGIGTIILWMSITRSCFPNKYYKLVSSHVIHNVLVGINKHNLKMKYPHLYLECAIVKKLTDSYTYLLSGIAYNELLKCCKELHMNINK